MMDRPAPSLDDLEVLARTAWDEMPSEFKRLAGDIVFRVEDVASDELLAELGIDLTQRSIADPLPTTPMVFLFRRAILDEWIERGDITLKELVSHVLVHEIGHHFGFSDDQMDAILDTED